MTDLMPFNPALVTIERKRFSTTQGETLISYDGQRIEQYGDNPRLIDGEYHQQPDEYWIEVAKRDAIDRFMCAPDGDFYATVEHHGVMVNVCRADFTYPRINFMWNVAKYARSIGAPMTAEIAEAKANYIRDTLELLVNHAMVATDDKAKENLISDLREVSDALADWANRELEQGESPEGIKAKLREAVRISGRS